LQEHFNRLRVTPLRRQLPCARDYRVHSLAPSHATPAAKYTGAGDRHGEKESSGAKNSSSDTIEVKSFQCAHTTPAAQ
jgi:hypothetical protein